MYLSRVSPMTRMVGCLFPSVLLTILNVKSNIKVLCYHYQLQPTMHSCKRLSSAGSELRKRSKKYAPIPLDSQKASSFYNERVSN